MEEIWKDIADTDGMYRVSNFGNVIVRDYKAKGYWRPVKLVTQDTGYLVATIYYNGVRKARLVHRLVATAFLPNHDNLPIINHKDQCPLNNNVDNLEWCTVQYNCTYGDAIERRRARLTGVYKSDIPVLQYTMSGDFVAWHKSSRDASFALCGDRGKKSQLITEVCKGTRNYSAGFQWRYAEENYPKKIDAFVKTDMVEQLSLDGEHIAYYGSAYAAQKQMGAVPSGIHKCCRGQRVQAHGYKWRYYSPKGYNKKGGDI